MLDQSQNLIRNFSSLPQLPTNIILPSAIAGGKTALSRQSRATSITTKKPLTGLRCPQLSKMLFKRRGILDSGTFGLMRSVLFRTATKIKLNKLTRWAISTTIPLSQSPSWEQLAFQRVSSNPNPKSQSTFHTVVPTGQRVRYESHRREL